MSYDDWLTRPYEVDNDPPEDDDEGPGCAICGVPVPPDQTYCGASCEQADSIDPAEIWMSDVNLNANRRDEDD